jgi:hypothetical protein
MFGAEEQVQAYFCDGRHFQSYRSAVDRKGGRLTSRRSFTHEREFERGKVPVHGNRRLPQSGKRLYLSKASRS